MYVNVEPKGWPWVFSSITLCLNFSDRVSHWTWRSSVLLGWLANDLQGSTSFPHSSSWITWLLCGYWGSKLQPSCLHSQHFTAELPPQAADKANNPFQYSSGYNYTSVLVFNIMFVWVKYLSSYRCLPATLLHLIWYLEPSWCEERTDSCLVYSDLLLGAVAHTQTCNAC